MTRPSKGPTPVEPPCEIDEEQRLVAETARHTACQPRALVVENDVDQQRAMRLMLEQEGYEVMVADHGAEALLRLRTQESIDLIVTDLVMPHVDGQDLIQQVRRVLPDVPILAVTGADSPQARLLGAEWDGATGVLPKPFDRRDFLEALEMVTG